MMWVAVAGPLTNITIAILASAVLKMVSGDLLQTVCIITIQINLILAIFNLFPIPPLDGSRVLAHFLPPHLVTKLWALEPYGIIIIFGLAYFGILQTVLLTIYRPLAILLIL